METLPADLIWLLFTKYFGANDAIVCLRLKRKWYETVISRGSLAQLQIAASKSKLKKVKRLVLGTDMPFGKSLIWAERELKRARFWNLCDGCGVDVTESEVLEDHVGDCIAANIGVCDIYVHFYCDSCADTYTCMQCKKLGCPLAFASVAIKMLPKEGCC